MPIASVEPIPLPPRLSRLAVPEEAQEASYLAASARMASFCCMSSWGICSIYVLSGCRSSLFEPAAGPLILLLTAAGDASSPERFESKRKTLRYIDRAQAFAGLYAGHLG